MYKFDIDITPSLNGKEIHLEGICEMYTIIQLTGHTNERTFYKYVKAPPNRLPSYWISTLSDSYPIGDKQGRNRGRFWIKCTRKGIC